MPTKSRRARPVVAPASPAIAEPAAEPIPALEPVRASTYPVEIRLQNAATTGESVYHVNWTTETVKCYLNDQLVKVRVPVRAHFGHESPPNVIRYVQMDAIAEVLIYNWPDVAGE